MTRIGLAFLALICTSVLLYSCDKGGGFNPCIIGELPLSDTSFRYDTSYYDAPKHFSIFPKAKVNLVSSDWHGFKVEAQGNVNSRIRSVQKDDTIYLDFKNCVFRYDQIDAAINGTDVEGLTVRDSSSIAFDESYSSPKLTLKLLGNVDGTVSGKITELILRSRSGSLISHNGSNNRLELTQNGNGDFNAEKAEINNAVIVHDGTGDIFLPEIQNKLIVEILDSGSVYYSGTPEISSNIVGAGRLIKR